MRYTCFICSEKYIPDAKGDQDLKKGLARCPSCREDRDRRCCVCQECYVPDVEAEKVWQEVALSKCPACRDNPARADNRIKQTVKHLQDNNLDLPGRNRN